VGTVRKKTQRLEVLRLPTRETGETGVCARVIDCARVVHEGLGPGLEPVFYMRALALQLAATGLRYQRDAWVEIRFLGATVGRRRLDFVLPDLVVEVLAVAAIAPCELMRVRSAARAAQTRGGLLLNFGNAELEARQVTPRD
jgi:GxxExxY protein